ncbi:hypothetical protein B0H11DRAFT_2244308 [Mycena galericulata]|nr:hypothetical protein B0H11DRAFT_2244308 [Mycena galericulata]
MSFRHSRHSSPLAIPPRSALVSSLFATMSTPPPEYADSDLDLGHLLSRLDGLNLSNESDPSPESTAPTYHPTPQPRTPSPPPTLALEAEVSPRLYHWCSAAGSGYTHDWEFAAAQTQGMPGGTPTRLTPKHKPRVKKGGFAVFVGREVGAFRHWKDVEPLVKGVSNCIYQGYRTFPAATAAFEYARERSWTRCTVPVGAPSATPPTAISRLPTPTEFSNAHNPLHGDDSRATQSLWYVVYCGITPGVYESSLECLLNTVGIRGARHDSCDSKEIAVSRYQKALSGGRIEILNPPYSL